VTGAAELWTLLRVLLSLVVVLTLAVVALRFGLPWLHGMAGRRRTQVQVLEIAALDRQHKVAVLRYRGRELLVAFGGGGFLRLAAFPAEPDPPPPDAA
jgi:hypothetical protein